MLRARFARTAITLQLVALTAIGCATATVGADFNASELSKLQVGRTTLDQAIQILGSKPQQSQMGASGAWGHTWTYVRSDANGVSGNTTTSLKSVTLVFSTEGTFQRVLQLKGVTLPEADRQRLTQQSR